MIKILVNGTNNLPYETFTFSGGEVHVKLSQKYVFTSLQSVLLNCRLESSEEVIRLLMVTDAVKRQYPGIDIHLNLPYLPYARQDRLCDSGEAMSLKVFASIINCQGYKSVRILDCHSDVGTALLDNIIHVEQSTVMEMNNALKSKLLDKECVIVSPDAGAMKKIYKVSKHFAGVPVVCANKERDAATGQILGVGLQERDLAFITKKEVLIVDDICDGGRTFIELAKLLRTVTNSIDLYVTHGIFSKGVEVFDGLINNVYTTNSIRDLKSANKLHVIDIFN